MAIVLDRQGNNHAVLLLRLSSGDVVLDSLATRIAKQTSSNKAEWGVLLSPQADR